MASRILATADIRRVFGPKISARLERLTGRAWSSIGWFTASTAVSCVLLAVLVVETPDLVRWVATATGPQLRQFLLLAVIGAAGGWAFGSILISCVRLIRELAHERAMDEVFGEGIRIRKSTIQLARDWGVDQAHFEDHADGETRLLMLTGAAGAYYLPFPIDTVEDAYTILNRLRLEPVTPQTFESATDLNPAQLRRTTQGDASAREDDGK